MLLILRFQKPRKFVRSWCSYAGYRAQKSECVVGFGVFTHLEPWSDSCWILRWKPAFERSICSNPLSRLWDTFWSSFGSLLVALWVTFGTLWGYFGVTLGSLWACWGRKVKMVKFHWRWSVLCGPVNSKPRFMRRRLHFRRRPRYDEKWHRRDE